MKWIQTIKLILIIIFSTLFILSGTYLGNFINTTVFKSTENYSEGTKLGTADLEGIRIEEVKEIVTNELIQWQESINITVNHWGVTESLPLDIYKFDILETVQSITDGKVNHYVVMLDKAKLARVIDYTSFGLANEEIQKFESDLLQIAQNLIVPDTAIDLANYLNQTNTDVVLSRGEVTFDLGYQFYVSDLIKETDIVTLPANGVFSFTEAFNLETVNLDHVPDSRKDAMSIIATAIYEAILPSTIDIVERHISRELPAYSELGKEAKVIPGEMELMLHNREGYDLNIQFIIQGTTLIAELKGPPSPVDYKVVQDDEATYPYKTIIQFSPLISIGGKKTEREGQPARYVKVLRESVNVRGDVERINISEDFYPPIHKIEVYSLKSTQLSNSQKGLKESAIEQSNTHSTSRSQAIKNNVDEFWGEDVVTKGQ
ncbi:VanW family protein [Bacillus solimangrovi]|uniref:G5 domain-containing protein n=1 Tax=Bacillus solimangrovi TaxID=1305675 RepID=A0A1E5LBI6_9BACI|nr:VanW family protein [Bacillus solimangrovi]OEH91450.1 hypothetical protein BFG57_04870 [Bacillus solimangrovi]